MLNIGERDSPDVEKPTQGYMRKKISAKNNILNYECVKTIFRFLFKKKPPKEDAHS